MAPCCPSVSATPLHRFLWLLALTLAAIGTSCHAAADFAEVNPGPQKFSPLKFEVQSERLPNGDTRFTITVSENIGSESRFAKFPEHFSTYLGAAKIIDYSEEERRKNPGAMSRSESYGFARRVESERKDDVITSVFTVTKEELADPDFCFFISEVSNSPIPGFSAWYARLKKFVKP